MYFWLTLLIVDCFGSIRWSVCLQYSTCSHLTSYRVICYCLSTISIHKSDVWVWRGLFVFLFGQTLILQFDLTFVGRPLKRNVYTNVWRMSWLPLTHTHTHPLGDKNKLFFWQNDLLWVWTCYINKILAAKMCAHRDKAEIVFDEIFDWNRIESEGKKLKLKSENLLNVKWQLNAMVLRTFFSLFLLSFCFALLCLGHCHIYTSVSCVLHIEYSYRYPSIVCGSKKNKQLHITYDATQDGRTDITHVNECNTIEEN